MVLDLSSFLSPYVVSVVYVVGWEYRHWDGMLQILADATIEHYGKSSELKAERNPFAEIQKNWAAVFASEKHETVEVWAEDKSITVLALLLIGSSKVLVPFWYVCTKQPAPTLCSTYYAVFLLSHQVRYYTR